MPRALVLPVFFAVLFLGAMLLGPLIYFTFQAALPGAVPFHRAMDRALLISAAAALVFFWSRIPLRVLWPWNRDALLQLLLGYLIAAVSLQAMLGFNLVLAGFESTHPDAATMALRIAIALLAALIVPPLEETVFRGFLQRELVSQIGSYLGWLLAAIIFMLAHFVKIPESVDHAPVGLTSGVTALGAAWAQFSPDLARPENLGKAINLLLVGLILGGVALRTGTLWLNAGLHSGWIFGLLIATGLTRPAESPRVPFFGGDILSSPSTTVVLVLTGLWIWRFYRHPSIVPEVGPAPTGATGPNAR
jgi:membrane protease YdiL (CAAX protease family)